MGVTVDVEELGHNPFEFGDSEGAQTGRGGGVVAGSLPGRKGGGYCNRLGDSAARQGWARPREWVGRGGATDRGAKLVVWRQRSLQRGLALIGAASLIVATLVEWGCNGRRQVVPSLVLVTVDALRHDYLSFAGDPHPTSPVLDALAEEGATFSQAITSFQGTTAAMPSLMTGLYPSFEGITSWNHATWTGFTDLKSPEEQGQRGLTANVVTLAERLSHRGFRTAGFNTNPNLSRFNYFDQGFDEYDDFVDVLDELKVTRAHELQGAYPPAETVVRRVLAWFDRNRDRPFFVWLHLMEPHCPYLPPAPYNRMFPRPATELTDLQLNEALYHLVKLLHGAPQEAARFPTHQQLGLSQGDFAAHLRALYRGQVRYADHELGHLFDGLRDRGLWQQTMVVVTADHGEEFFEHGHVIHHLAEPAPEELIRIPLVVKLPGELPRHRRVADLVRLVDIAPTTLDYLGVDASDFDFDGRTLRPLLEGRTDPPRNAFLNGIGFAALRGNRWKYRADRDPATGEVRAERLYDILADPLERVDLAGQHADVVESLRALARQEVERLRRRSGGAALVQQAPAITPEEESALRALGYLP